MLLHLFDKTLCPAIYIKNLTSFVGSALLADIVRLGCRSAFWTGPYLQALEKIMSRTASFV